MTVEKKEFRSPLNLRNGGVSDDHVTIPIPFGDASNTSLDDTFTAASQVGAWNESKQVKSTYPPYASTVTIADAELSTVYFIDTSGGSVVVTIPDSAAANDEKWCAVYKNTDDANIVTVKTVSNQNIASVTTQVITETNKGFRVVSDFGSTKWNIIQDSRFGSGLSGSIAFFLSDTASDIGGYLYMYPTDTGEPESSYVSGSLTVGNDQALEEWATEATEPNITTLLGGIYSLHMHVERTSGLRSLEVYWELYKRASGGAETLLGTSEISSAITTKEGVDLTVSLAADEDLLTTDRLIAKTYANVGSSGSDIVATIFMEGTNASRLAVPANSAIFDQRYFVKPGISGGQVAIGGNAAGENLTLQSTSNATRGEIIANDPVNAARTIGTPVTAATHTFAFTDANDYIDIGSASGVVVTVPDNASVAFDIGSEIEGRNSGAGDITFSPALGVTINSDRLTVSEGGYWALKKVGTDEWVLAVSSPDGRLLGADVTGTTYTFAIDDANKYIDIGNASGVAVTVPDNATVAFPVTTEIEGRNSGTGNVTFSAAVGVTINNTGLVVPPGGAWALKKVGTNEWDFVSSGVKGSLTESASNVFTITGGTDSVNGPGTSIEVLQADASTDGYISSADWNTFNGKQSAITNGVDALTSGEVTQLAAINTVIISNTQWGYLGSSDQGIATTDNVQFANTTSNGGQFVKRTDAGAAGYNPSALTTDYLITANNTAAARAITISNEDVASGSAANPRTFVIKDEYGNAATNNITLSLETGNIDGAASIVINNDYQAITLYCDGTSAYIV